MPTQRDCGAIEIEANIVPAKATGRMYAAIELTVVGNRKAADGTETIEFVVRGDETGTRHVATWALTDEMWAPCPSSLPSAATPTSAGPAPASGVFGRLYLSEQFLKDRNIVAAPKWPSSLPEAELPNAELEIHPLKLELTGLEMKSGTFQEVKLDLLDPAHVAQRQTLQLDGTSPLKLRVTEYTFSDLFLPFIPDAKLIDTSLTILNKKTSSARERATAWSVVASATEFLASAGGSSMNTDTRTRLEEFLALQR